MMKLREIMHHLQSKGWTCGRDSTGERYGVKDFDNLQIQLLPLFDKRNGYVIFSLEPSISLKQFSFSCAFIMQEKNDFAPLISRDGWPPLSLEVNPPQREFIDLKLHDVDLLEEEAIEWAKKQDIDKAIKYYANLPTNSAGSLPLCHLAALVIQGNKERLEYYCQSFLNGDRLGFVPYITDEVIDRAVELVGMHSKRSPS